MDGIELIRKLQMIATIAAVLAAIFLAAGFGIWLKYPPSKMKEIIRQARILADPKRRKAVENLSVSQKRILLLLQNMMEPEEENGWNKEMQEGARSG